MPFGFGWPEFAMLLVISAVAAGLWVLASLVPSASKSRVTLLTPSATLVYAACPYQHNGGGYRWRTRLGKRYYH